MRASKLSGLHKKVQLSGSLLNSTKTKGTFELKIVLGSAAAVYVL